jgi:hypothetical protein
VGELAADSDPEVLGGPACCVPGDETQSERARRRNERPTENDTDRSPFALVSLSLCALNVTTNQTLTPSHTPPIHNADECSLRFARQKYFRREPYYADLLDVFHETTYQTEYGQLVDLITAPEDVVDLGKFSLER